MRGKMTTRDVRSMLLNMVASIPENANISVDWDNDIVPVGGRGGWVVRAPSGHWSLNINVFDPSKREIERAMQEID